MKKYIIPLLIIQLSSLSFAHVIPFITIRSQSQNAARELVLWQTTINLFEAEEFNCNFNATVEYTRTFEPDEIAKALFSDILEQECVESGCPRFLVQGSAVTDRNSRALLAENFGLPQDYSSEVCLRPRMSNVLIDFNLFLGLDQWAEGLFFRIHAPFVRTESDLGFCEKEIVVGSDNYPLGYFNGTVANPGDPAALHYGVARSQLVETFGNFMCGQVPNIPGITFDPLQKARIAHRELKKIGLSEIEAGLGWNFARGDDYHVGVSIRAGFPTGNRPNARCLFEPIVGNGHHWEIGFGFTSHWIAWQSFDCLDELALYFDANVFHLIKSRQCRTFDLCGKPLSRYMLASKMTNPAENLKDVQGNSPTFQFDDEFSSVANLSTLPVDVSVPILADAVFKISYTHKDFQFDLGYNFWGRSCEKIETITRCCEGEDTIWALKGDSFVYGFANDGNQTPVPLSASESKATIACGTNNINRVDSLFWYTNPGVDNAKCAFDSTGNNIQNLVGGTAHNMFSSFDPVVFSTHDTTQWNIKGARTSGMSHKIFMNFGYLWPDCRECFTPYIGVGAEVEFGATDMHFHCGNALCCPTGVPAVTDCELDQTRNCGERFDRDRGCDNSVCRNACSNNNSSSCDDNNCRSHDRDCFTFTPSQWGVWFKAGISYNS